MARPLISAAKMDRLRRVDERAMPSTCQVLRRARTTTGGRTSYGDEAPVGASVACRLQRAQLRPDEVEAVGRLGDTTHGELHLPLGTDLKNDDRVEVTTNAVAITVVVVGEPWAGSYDTHLTATVEREG